MSLAGDTGGVITGPAELYGSSCGWFRDQLRGRAIKLHPSSKLEQALARMEDFRGTLTTSDQIKFSNNKEACEWCSAIFGIDVLTKAIHWGHYSGLDLGPRWDHLGKGDPLLTRVTSETDKWRNETWEIVIASLAATFATDIRFTEPDVTCTFGGLRYGVAAKVAYSEASLYKRLKEGTEQLEKAHQAGGRFDAGLIFVDVVALVPQEQMLLNSRTWRFEHAEIAASTVKTWASIWCDCIPLEKWAADLRGRTKLPVGIAFFMPFFFDMFGKPWPFLYTHLPLSWMGDAGPDFAFAERFLEASNFVGHFRSEAGRTFVGGWAK
jgi:hypothetical protein